jgi:hypothetical protein
VKLTEVSPRGSVHLFGAWHGPEGSPDVPTATGV